MLSREEADVLTAAATFRGGARELDALARVVRDRILM
jgi:hypothetical protein